MIYVVLEKLQNIPLHLFSTILGGTMLFWLSEIITVHATLGGMVYPDLILIYLLATW